MNIEDITSPQTAVLVLFRLSFGDFISYNNFFFLKKWTSLPSSGGLFLTQVNCLCKTPTDRWCVILFRVQCSWVVFPSFERENNNTRVKNRPPELGQYVHHWFRDRTKMCLMFVLFKFCIVWLSN